MKKTCNKCKVEKPLTEFASRANRKSGYDAQCKPCYNERKRRERRENPEVYRATRLAWVKANPDKVSEADRRWYYNNLEQKLAYRKQWALDNPEKRLWSTAKSRAGVRGIEFSIDIADVVIPTLCPVLGIPLKKNIGKCHSDDSPSLDRVNNARGYVKGNVRVISYRANRLKGDATAEELRKLIDYMECGGVSTAAAA